MLFTLGFTLILVGWLWAKLCRASLGPFEIAGIELRKVRWHEYVASVAIILGLLLVVCSGLMLTWKWLP